jgi:hypothetical protein
MNKIMMILLVCVVLVVIDNSWAGTPGVDYSFGEWARLSNIFSVNSFLF